VCVKVSICTWISIVSFEICIQCWLWQTTPWPKTPFYFGTQQWNAGLNPSWTLQFLWNVVLNPKIEGFMSWLSRIWQAPFWIFQGAKSGKWNFQIPNWTPRFFTGFIGNFSELKKLPINMTKGSAFREMRISSENENPKIFAKIPGSEKWGSPVKKWTYDLS